MDELNEDDVAVLGIKVKAVELLEVMLEETSPHSSSIRRGLQETVNVDNLWFSMAYFRLMSENSFVKDAKKDDDAERAKFQCYHVLVVLADDADITMRNYIKGIYWK